MKNKDFEGFFDDLNFDIEEPHTGHQERFFKKLEKKKKAPEDKGRTRRLWTSVITIAASFVLAFLLLGEFLQVDSSVNHSELASISPEMKQTQDFYSSLITKELNAINAEKSPETEAIINDALNQMKKLERNYEDLKKDLVSSGKDDRVIHAMIQNFQQRIDLLNNTLTQIENLKTLKNYNHEDNII